MVTKRMGGIETAIRVMNLHINNTRICGCCCGILEMMIKNNRKGLLDL